ncbi:hypothetical protein [Sphingobium abikonense]|uniref:hypothetical protein n=1 Tax=Sphingobium abikonense TaxID=86193 RepID=UPI003515D765
MGQPLKVNQAKSNRGGKREGAGRPKGAPNKATASIREIARLYTDDAVNALVRVLTDGSAPHAAVVSAANSILDRGYGKAATIVQGDEDGGAVKFATRIELVGVRPE